MQTTTFANPKILAKPVCVLLAITLATACSSNKPSHSGTRPKPQETFSTDIQPDGTKLFSYSLEMPRKDKGKTRHGTHNRHRSKAHPGSSSGNTGTQNREQRLQAKIESLLDQKIEDSGYCKEGFIILDSYIGQGKATIRGECRDGASEEEIKTATSTL